MASRSRAVLKFFFTIVIFSSSCLQETDKGWLLPGSSKVLYYSDSYMKRGTCKVLDLFNNIPDDIEVNYSLPHVPKTKPEMTVK